jgi:sensor histidine kinase YesM
MNKKRLYWACQIGGWAAYGGLQIALLSLAGEISSELIIGEFFQVIFYILLTHFLRGTILFLGWLTFKWYQLIPRILFAALILAAVNYAFLVFLSYLMGDLVPQQDFSGVTIAANIFISTALLIFWSLLYLSFHYFQRYNKSLQDEAALKEIELTNLKSQLNPHFMFNALNSIRALVDENPTKSKNAITQLSNILRNSLTTDRKKLINFNEELETVKDYLALESIRYEERLETRYDIDPASKEFYIPPLMIQTLVENGIKHGIATLKEGGRIHIKTTVKERHLEIEIRNNGNFQTRNSNSIGYGLLNTRKRIELIYGEEASFFIGNEKDGIVLTKIKIPRET